MQRSNTQGSLLFTVLSNTNNDNKHFVFRLQQSAPKLKQLPQNLVMSPYPSKQEVPLKMSAHLSGSL